MEILGLSRLDMIDEKAMKERKKAINSLMERINKESGKTGSGTPLIFRASDRPDLVTTQHITTSIPQVDEAFGGGVPKGIVTTFWGPYNCGKTFLAMRIASQVAKAGGTVLYVDLEGMGKSLSLFEQKLGLNPEQVYVLRANDYGDELVDAIEALLYDPKTKSPRNIIDLVIVDSITNLAPKANMDKVDKDGAAGGTKVGAHAKLMTDWLTRYYGRGVCAGDQAVILISQARAAISTSGGGHGPQFQATGGNSVLHDSRLMVKFGRKVIYKKIPTGLAAVGQTVILTIDKNSTTGLIGKKVEYSVNYAADLDDIDNIINKLTEWGYITNAKRGYKTIICPPLGDINVKNAELEHLLRAREEIYDALKTIYLQGKPKQMPELVGNEYLIENISEDIDPDLLSTE